MNVKHTYLLIVVFFWASCQPAHQKSVVQPEICPSEEQQLISKACSAWDNQDYHTCLKAYQAAYEIHNNVSPQKSSNDILYIARCYAMLNHKEEAEKYYLKALELTQIAYGPVHERVADIF